MTRTGAGLMVLAIALITLAPARTEDRPYFALSSHRTWAPDETPTVHLWGENIPALEFRVYRVNDPVKFFQTLKDAHSFGGPVPTMPTEVSPIERFHQIKRGWRTCFASSSTRRRAPASTTGSWRGGRPRQRPRRPTSPPSRS